MANLTVINHVTLDGVMQAPGRPTRTPATASSTAAGRVPYGDPVMAEFMGKGMTGRGALLFGRRTYEDFAAVWPSRRATRSARCSTSARSTSRRRRCRAAAVGQLDAPAGRRGRGRGAAQGGNGREPGRARQRRPDPDAHAPRPRRRVRRSRSIRWSSERAPPVRGRRSSRCAAARRVGDDDHWGDHRGLPPRVRVAARRLLPHRGEGVSGGRGACGPRDAAAFRHGSRVFATARRPPPRGRPD